MTLLFWLAGAFVILALGLRALWLLVRWAFSIAVGWFFSEL